jgi:F0F1-type ATP synthase assembly protein I
MALKETGAKMAEKEKKSRMKTAGQFFIPGGLFIGLGIGWLMDYLVAGLFIGLGGGFLLYGLAMLLARD